MTNNDVNSTPVDHRGSGFDPHSEQLTTRDWSFLGYMLALGLLPVIAAIVIAYVLFSRYPQFDDFPKGPAPLGYEAPSAPIIRD